MNRAQTTVSRHEALPLHITKLLRNTYLLLSMTLLFSAAMAGVAMIAGVGRIPVLLVLVGYFGLLFGVYATRNSALGLLMVFALTGFMGFTLGPILSAYIAAFSNGAELIMMAMGGTGAIFLGLSGYVLVSRRDFSFLRGFLLVGVVVVFLATLLNVFLLQLPGLAMALAVMWIIVSSGIILWQTSDLVHGYETNYITATVTLYVQIFNLFLSLLQILGFTMGED